MSLQDRPEIRDLVDLGITRLVALNAGDVVLAQILEEQSKYLIEGLVEEGYDNNQIISCIEYLIQKENPQLSIDDNNSILMDIFFPSGHRVILKSMPLDIGLSIIQKHLKDEILSLSEYKGILFKIMHLASQEYKTKIQVLLNTN